tara:strand:+ start:12044 stop:14902 length:2859 start_codon:yes stop_codon:yes gene_type:complete
MGLSFKSLAKAVVRVIVHAGITFALATIPVIGPALANAYAFSALSYESSRAFRPSLAGGIERKRGYEVTQRGSTIAHQIIYGKMKVAGARIFDGTTGTDNVDLHRVVAFAGHEITSFEQIYINDEVATIDGSGTVTSPSRYQGKIKIYEHLGSPDQLADSNLVSAVSSWTDNHRLRGIAYLYCKFTFDADAFPNNVPEITAVIKGKKLYDPRSPSAANAWSDNPALCVRDYLTSTGYGLGEANANINDTAFITAANICDETSTNAGTTRYTANGAFTTAIEPQELIADLMTSMGGTIWYTQGYWNVKAAKWTAPVLDLNEDDLRSGLSLSTRHSRRDNFNSVKGTFKGSESNWVVTDFPPVTNDAFVLADNGQESSIDYDFPWTDNSIEARRTARIVLERNRQQLQVQASFGLRAFQVQTGDNVRITNTRLGWTNKEFEVVSWTFGLQNEYDLQVEMTLKEISESVFDEVDDGVVYERDNTTLLSPFTVPELGINLSTELRRVKGKTLGVLLIDINNTSTIMDTAEVQFKKTGDTNYTSLATIGAFVGTDRVEVVGVEDGFYDIRARATNSLGVHGTYNTISNHFVEALGSPPADVTNFDGNVVGSNLFLTWTPVTDLDLAHYIIRYSHLTSGAVYSEAEDIAQVPVGSSSLAIQSAGVGTYFIKAVDDTTSGSNVSVNPATFVVTSIGIENLNVVATLTENPSFAGVKSGVAINGDGYLELDITPLFDDATGLFDDKSGELDDFTGYASSGIYYFSNALDLGQKYTSRLNYTFTSTRFDVTDKFDSATGLFDARSGVFDGDPTAFNDTSVSLQLRHTDDDPSGTPTWTDWQSFSVSDIAARAFEFRLIMTSTNTNVTPVVSALAAIVDMPDRVESGNDITFTGTTNVTFATGFAATPAIGLSLANLTDGDRYTITSKTRTGFTINTFTGGSTSTNAVTLDYVAKGYGKEIT